MIKFASLLAIVYLLAPFESQTHAHMNTGHDSFLAEMSLLLFSLHFSPLAGNINMLAPTSASCGIYSPSATDRPTDRPTRVFISLNSRESGNNLELESAANDHFQSERRNKLEPDSGTLFLVVVVVSTL